MELPHPLRGALVAMTRDHVIGVNGKLPWHYSADLKRFKRMTTGYTIIMGRLTWESIGSKPLPNRRNIVVSSKGLSDVENYSSVEQAIAASADRDIWVIGGGQIYRAAFEHLNWLDITWVPDQIDDPAAVTFPKVNPNQWKLVEESVIEEDDRLINSVYLRK